MRNARSSFSLREALAVEQQELVLRRRHPRPVGSPRFLDEERDLRGEADVRVVPLQDRLDPAEEQDELEEAEEQPGRQKPEDRFPRHAPMVVHGLVLPATAACAPRSRAATFDLASRGVLP